MMLGLGAYTGWYARNWRVTSGPGLPLKETSAGLQEAGQVSPPGMATQSVVNLLSEADTCRLFPISRMRCPVILK